jgi:hypothetical protein
MEKKEIKTDKYRWLGKIKRMPTAPRQQQRKDSKVFKKSVKQCDVEIKSPTNFHSNIEYTFYILYRRYLPKLERGP